MPTSEEPQNPDLSTPPPNHPLLNGLNSVQSEAVQFRDGPLLLFAGAGSGKTRVLTHRVAYLIDVHGVSPRNILAVTFTNKAAQEMKERIEKITGEHAARNLWVGTFHSICVRLLREFGERIGIKRDFVVYDDSDQITLVRDCLRELQLDDKKFTPRSVLSHISRAKEKRILPEDWKNHFVGYFEDICGKAYDLYQQKLRLNNALDFDDLLAQTVVLLEQSSETLERLQNRYHYLLVDEYQDVNQIQYLFLKYLATKRRNICVVGDDDQSIYLFRGADVGLILQFEQDYPDAKVLKLEQNYRSSQTILDAAYGVVSRNRTRKDKRLWTENPVGKPLLRNELMNEQEEAIWVVQRIHEAIKNGGRVWSDFVVLYRTNAQSRAFEDVFVNWNLPYKVVGGVRFYERREVKDLLCYLRVVQNPLDSVSLRRILNVPARSIGTSTLKALEEEMTLSGRSLWAILEDADSLSTIVQRTRTRLKEFVNLISTLRRESLQLSVTELARRTLELTGYQKMLEDENTLEAQSRLENVRELLSKATLFDAETPEATLSGFLENVALVADIDSLDSNANAITLMTLHSAKGLEFPVVFLVGMEENIFPHYRSLESDREMEEERRLCYVGMTRAKEELFLSHASRRTQFGNIAYNAPSRFLREVPKELFLTKRKNENKSVSTFDPDATEGERNKIPAHVKLWDSTGVPPAQAVSEDAFRAGQKVKHEKFGVGVVITITGEGDKTMLEIAFPNLGIKKLLLAYAKLEKVR